MSKFSELFSSCSKWMHEQKPDTTANQYLLDTGTDARRGFTYGGIHMWEHMVSQGSEHFVKGLAPLTVTGTRDGLYIGENNLPFDEIKAATLAKEKLESHWGMAQGDPKPFLEVDWKHRVTVQHDEDGNSLLIHSAEPFRAVLLGEHIPEENGYITAFYIGDHMPALLPVLKTATQMDVIWIAPHQSVLAFDSPTVGGVISCWFMAGKPGADDQKETIKVKIGGETFTYHRHNNLIQKGEQNMKIDIPTVPTEKAEKQLPSGETTNPKIEPEEVEKPAKVAPPESVSGENVPELTIEEQLEAAFNKAETLKTLASELVKELKPLIKAVAKMKKESANSTEVKELKAENKDLTAKNKALEKELAAKKQALKLLVGGENF